MNALILLFVLFMGVIFGDLSLGFTLRQAPQGMESAFALESGWDEMRLKASLSSFEASWVVLRPRGPVPVRFEIDGLKGELRVKRGQRIKKGQVLAVVDVELLQRLERELPTLEPELKQEAQEKMEELLIRAVVEGVVQEIRIEAVEGETLRLLLDVKPLYIANKKK